MGSRQCVMGARHPESMSIPSEPTQPAQPTRPIDAEEVVAADSRSDLDSLTRAAGRPGLPPHDPGEERIHRRRAREAAAEIEAVRRVLESHDPLGLIAPGSTSEYQPEAESIVLRLLDERATLQPMRDAAALQALVHEEFIRWFDERLAGPAERYAEIARDMAQTVPDLIGSAFCDSQAHAIDVVVYADTYAFVRGPALVSVNALMTDYSIDATPNPGAVR